MHLAAILVHLADDQPNEQASEYGKDKQHNACIEVVTLHAAPHLEHLLQVLLVGEVADNGTTFDDLSVGILHRVHLHAIGFRTEEIAQIRIVGQRGINLFFQNLRSGHGTYITDGIHVAKRNVWTAHVVDEVAGSLHVAGILRYHPTVEPHVATFERHDIVQLHSHFGSFFNRPNGITTPSEVHPSLALGHHFLTEVGFPTGNVRLQRLEVFFGHGDGFVRVIVHQLFHGHFALRQAVTVGIDDGQAIAVAVAVLHQELVRKLRVPHVGTLQGFFIGHQLSVVKRTGSTPHVSHRIVGHLLVSLAHLVQLVLNVGSQVRDIVGCLAEVTVDGQQHILAHHSLDDVLRRAHHVEILVSALNLGEHHLVDVEHLIDDFNVLARLFLVPFGELRQHIFVDVVGPVIHLQDALTFFV